MYTPAFFMKNTYSSFKSVWIFCTFLFSQGLAVMGQNLILNMNDHGFVVVAYNRTTAKVDQFLENEVIIKKNYNWYWYLGGI